MGTFVKKNKLNNSSKWFTFGQKIGTPKLDGVSKNRL